MWSKVAVIFVIFVVTGLLAQAHATRCPRYVAPHNFNDKPPSWGGTDSGPIVPGFIDSRRSNTKALLRADQGIDLAAGNHVDYRDIRSCGGKFAFVRINHSRPRGLVDQDFLPNVKSLNKVGVKWMPYYYFFVRKRRKKLEKFEHLSDKEVRALLPAYRRLGKRAAQEFFRFVHMLSKKGGVNAFPVVDLGGLKGRLAAIDVEQTPIRDAKLSRRARRESKASRVRRERMASRERRDYGRLYAAAVCEWTRVVRSRYRDAIPVLYMFPSIYSDYLRSAYSDASNCLARLPVWIARTSRNGWEAVQNIDAANCSKYREKPKRRKCTVDEMVKHLCETAAGNRCIFHQYTHRGTAIAIGKRNRKGIPPHIDMDRFYEATSKRTYAGIQYVRVVDGFRSYQPGAVDVYVRKTSSAAIQ